MPRRFAPRNDSVNCGLLRRGRTPGARPAVANLAEESPTAYRRGSAETFPWGKEDRRQAVDEGNRVSIRRKVIVIVNACRIPHPTSLRSATFPPGKVYRLRRGTDCRVAALLAMTV